VGEEPKTRIDIPSLCLCDRTNGHVIEQVMKSRVLSQLYNLETKDISSSIITPNLMHLDWLVPFSFYLGKLCGLAGMLRMLSLNCLSADERALVLGAKQLGFVFHTRLPEHVTITVVWIWSVAHCRKLSDFVVTVVIYQRLLMNMHRL